ncbi:TPA: hypothetical protein ACQ715_004875 [Escherichia coli]
MTALNKQALRKTAEKAQEHGVFNMDIHSQTVLELLASLEAAEKRIAAHSRTGGADGEAARISQFTGHAHKTVL